MQNHKYKSCTRKVRYSTGEFAEKQSLKFMAIYGNYVYSYECRYCGGFHLTTRTQKKRTTPWSKP